jgi:hypothetical protein
MSTGTVRASTVPGCADLYTPEQLQRQTEKREARSADIISAVPLHILPPGSSTLQPRHASLPLPARPGPNLLGFSNLQEHESVLCYTCNLFLALNLPLTLATWSSCMRFIFSLAFSPNSSQLGHDSFQRGTSRGPSRVKGNRGLLLGSLNTISFEQRHEAVDHEKELSDAHNCDATPSMPSQNPRGSMISYATTPKRRRVSVFAVRYTEHPLLQAAVSVADL